MDFTLVQYHSFNKKFYFEHTTSPLGLLFVSLGVLAGATCAYLGWKKHKNTMSEIEQNIAELKNFE